MSDLYGTVACYGRFESHCGVVRLDQPHEGREFAVLNMETLGRGKLPFEDGHLVVGTPVVISKFQMGSEAILALEVSVKGPRVGYGVGCRPPDLDEKTGTFPHPTHEEFRTSSFVNGAGELISINMDTKLLQKEGDDED